jgi:hypothetical protein
MIRPVPECPDGHLARALSGRRNRRRDTNGKEIEMKIVRNIKEIRIDWLKIAAALSASSPYGPVIGPDGTVYSCDGQVLAPGSDTAASTPTEPPATATAPVRHNPRPAPSVRVNRRAPVAA